jgi:hypothetical protein
MITVPLTEAVKIPGSALERRGGDNSTANEKLDGWKEIAGYLRRTTRTVQRWERTEGLPILRHQHAKGATVYAYQQEVDQWWRGGRRVVAATQRNHT